MKKFIYVICIAIINIMLFTNLVSANEQKKDGEAKEVSTIDFVQEIAEKCDYYFMANPCVLEYFKNNSVQDFKKLNSKVDDFVMTKIYELKDQINSFCMDDDEKRIMVDEIIKVFPYSEIFDTYCTVKDDEQVDNITDSLFSTLDNYIEDIENDIISVRVIYSRFTKDLPKYENRKEIAKYIYIDVIPEKYRYDFNREITVGEYAEIFAAFNDCISINDFEINDHKIKNGDDYVVLAYLFGMIDKYSDLDKKLTREEMAHIIAPFAQTDKVCGALDYDSIDPRYLDDVGNSGMKLIDNNFRPNEYYKLEDAIVDLSRLKLSNRAYLRGIFPINVFEDGDTIILKDYSILGDKEKNIGIEIKTKSNMEYYKRVLTRLIPINDEVDFTKEIIDYGPFYANIDEKNSLIQFIVKRGCSKMKFANNWLEDNYYIIDGAIRNNMEATIRTKPANMDMTNIKNKRDYLIATGDSYDKDLRQRVKKITDKIIKKNKDIDVINKLKAVYKYIATTMKYDENKDYTYGDLIISAVNGIKLLDKKVGASNCYSILFHYFCEELAIPNKIVTKYDEDSGRYYHWNVVYLNKKWVNVDIAFDDKDTKVDYNYFLKTTADLMNTHDWHAFGNIRMENFDIDPSAIKSTTEFRLFIFNHIICSELHPKDVKLRLMNDDIDFSLDYLKVVLSEYTLKRYKYSITYEEETQMYVFSYSKEP